MIDARNVLTPSVPPSWFSRLRPDDVRTQVGIPIIFTSMVALFVYLTASIHQAPFFFFIFSIGLIGWLWHTYAAVVTFVYATVWLMVLFGVWASDQFPYSASMLRFMGYFLNSSMIVFLIYTRDRNLKKLRGYAEGLEAKVRQNVEENRKLAMIAKRSHNAVILTDRFGRIEWINDGFTRITEYTLADAMGQKPGHLLQGPQTDPVTMDIMRAAIKRGEGFFVEIVNYTKSHKPYWIEVDVEPIHDADGQIVQFMAIERDITEAKRIRTELAQSEQRYRDAFEQAAVGIGEVSASGELLHANQRLLDIWGLSKDQLHALHHYLLIHHDDRQLYTEKSARLLRGEADRFSMELRLLRDNAPPIWVNLTVSLVRHADQSPNYFIVITEDITLRQQMQSALFESEDRLRRMNENLERLVAERTAEMEALIDAAPVGIWVSHDPICEQLSSNRFARELFGLPTAEATNGLIPWTIARNVKHSFRGTPIDRNDLPMQRAAATGQVIRNFEIDEHFNGQDPITLIGNAAPLFDDQHQIRGMVAVCVDISARRLTEQRLEQLNQELEERVRQRTQELALATAAAESASKAKGEFLSRMSHELRTPLNAVLGFTQLLKLGELNSKQIRQLEQIEKAGKYLLEMINEVLDFSRIEAGWLELALQNLSLFNITQEALDLIRPLAEEKQIELITDPRLTLEIQVMADHLRLRQVFINLFSNAIKYNVAGGQVTVNLNSLTDSSVSVTIHNTGDGILAEDRAKLFRPFDRLSARKTESEGTGLGLVVSQRLVQAMAGNLSLVEDDQPGCTFLLSLPRSSGYGQPIRIVQTQLSHPQPLAEKERT